MKALFVAIMLAMLPTLGVAQAASNAPIAEVRWLDRITGEQGDVALYIGQEANLGALTVIVEECRYPRGSISTDAFAFIDIKEAGVEKDWFSGWMVASSPGLNALEHPRYDIWVLRCRTN